MYETWCIIGSRNIFLDPGRVPKRYDVVVVVVVGVVVTVFKKCLRLS